MPVASFSAAPVREPDSLVFCLGQLRLEVSEAVLDLFFSHASNGATFTDLDRKHLYRIKYQPAEQSPPGEEVTAA